MSPRRRFWSAIRRYDGSGSGYHRGASAGEISTEAALLAAADAYRRMTDDRAHRPALPADQAADAVAGEAVVETAGRRRPEVRTPRPAGLSDREVEVLRLVARGLSNRALAAELVIPPRTAEHHVQHIYTKIGVSTRAAAALFAMEHGLLRT